MEWLPAVRAAVEIEATPPERVALPRVVPPSVKVTVPVAPDGVTVAESVKVWP